MRKKIFFSFIIFLILIFGSYIIINNSIGDVSSIIKPIKRFIPKSIKDKLKETIFVYKNQELLKKKIEEKLNIINERDNIIENTIANYDLHFVKYYNKNINLGKQKYNFQRYKTFQLIKSIHDTRFGSAYLDYYNNKLFIISADGIIAYTEKIDDEYIRFKHLKSNIKDLIIYDDFYDSSKKCAIKLPSCYTSWFSIKDLLIYDNKIYISYTNQVKRDCYNTSILVSDLKYNFLKFKKLFAPEECVSTSNEDNEFDAQQSGGRMVHYKNDEILLSVGDYRLRKNSQNKSSIFGKILAINLNTGKHKLISMGHRNPQGLLYVKENDLIISTDHGPADGDEINVNTNPDNQIKNYGWAISSYGEHYGGKIARNKKKYQNYPLKKSHKDYGFIEPIKYYVPSIGISEIIKIYELNNNDKYNILVSSLRAKKLFLYHLNKEYKVLNEEVIEVGERIRDMIFAEDINKILLFLENTASIGIIDLKNVP